MRPTPTISCDTDALQAYLQGTASALQHEWLESHLNTCLQCRQTIETDAASCDFWQAATVALAHPPGEAAQSILDTQAIDKIDAMLVRPIDTERIGSNSVRNKLEDLLKTRLQSVEDQTKLGRMGKYEIESIAGHGGMGVVLKAFDHDLNRPVAIKTLLLDRSDDAAARQRLLREAKAVASLKHPNIIQIYNVELWQELPLIVMPFIAEQTLQQAGASNNLSADDILSIARQLASALVAAHQSGVIHRDLKPSNVLLERGVDKILLSDFGLARFGGDHTVTQTGNLAGTPQFMSPEQAQGHELTDRTDIFSLGSLLYWLCTRRYPFDAATPYAILIKLVNSPPAPIATDNIPSHLSGLIERLMAKSPADRPNAAQALAWIDECIAFGQHPQRNTTLSFLSATPSNARWKWAVACITILMIAVGLGTWATYNQPALSPTVSVDPIVSIPQPSAPDPAPIPKPESIAQVPVANPEPELNLRYGVLDELDISNMNDDLRANRNVLYWLRRLAYLSASDIPPSCVAAVDQLSRSTDDAVRELALVILSKNPFEEITPYQDAEPSASDENPFVEIDPAQINSNN